MDRVLSITGTLSGLLVCAAGVGVLGGCSDGDSTNAPPVAIAPSGADPASVENGTAGTGEASSRYSPSPATSQPLVRINTSLGPIDVRLDPEAAPVTVQNFLNYVESDYYVQTVFHYVEDGELILGGGVAADGTAKPVQRTIRNEAHNGRKNKRGTIAMARDADVIDSAASQFFINLQDAPHLDYSGDTPDQYGYCVFGNVVRGLEIAEQISAIPTKTQQVDGVDFEVPTKMVRIESVQVLR